MDMHPYPDHQVNQYLRSDFSGPFFWQPPTERSVIEGIRDAQAPLSFYTAAALLSAYRNIDLQVTEYVGAPHSSAIVEALSSEPTHAHDRLGEIVVSANTEPAPSASEIEQQFKVEAAKIGWPTTSPSQLRPMSAAHYRTEISKLSRALNRDSLPLSGTRRCCSDLSLVDSRPPIWRAWH